MTLHEEATPIICELARALANVLPEGWTSAKLSVRQGEMGTGVAQHRHAIRNEMGQQGRAQPDEAVFDATWKLYQAFLKHEQPWAEADVTMGWLPAEERWDCEIELRYSPEVRERMKQRAAEPARKE